MVFHNQTFYQELHELQAAIDLITINPGLANDSISNSVSIHIHVHFVLEFHNFSSFDQVTSGLMKPDSNQWGNSVCNTRQQDDNGDGINVLCMGHIDILVI